MEFIIDPSIIAKFPHVKIGILIAHGITNGVSPPGLIAEMRSAEVEARKALTLEHLADHPKMRDWRDAYRAFGTNPKTFKNSAEALLRRVLKGDALPDINPVVNCYNTISIKHLLPAGGDDLDKVEGRITLTIAKGGERFVLLGSRQEETAEPGEAIYRDDVEVLCRRWNYRESDKTKMTSSTTNVCLVIEGLGATTKEEMEAALNNLKTVIERYCGGTTATHVLDGARPTACF